MQLAYIWIVSHLTAKNCRNLWKFDEVLTKTNLLCFFWDTVYNESHTRSPANVDPFLVSPLVLQVITSEQNLPTIPAEFPP